mgnify:CR=1 FL=1
MPATVSLAIPLYEKWELLEKNLAAIFASIAAGVLTSLGSVLARPGCSSWSAPTP